MDILEVMMVIGAIVAILGILLLSSIEYSEFSALMAIGGIFVIITSLFGMNKLSNIHDNSFQLIKAGYINPVADDSGNFGVTVPGIDQRVRLRSKDDRFTVIDLGGTERVVKTPADVRKLVGK